MPNEPFDFYKELQEYNMLDNILYGIVKTNMVEKGPGDMDYGFLGNIINFLNPRYKLPARMNYYDKKVDEEIDGFKDTYSPQVRDKLSEFKSKRVPADGVGGSVPFQNIDYVRKLAAELAAKPENMEPTDRLSYDQGQALKDTASAQVKTAENERLRDAGAIEAEIQRLEAEIAEGAAERAAKAESARKAAESAYELAKIKNQGAVDLAEREGENMTDYANKVNQGRIDIYKLKDQSYEKEKNRQDIYNAIDTLGDLLNNFSGR